jgi:hypothetical protein
MAESLDPFEVALRERLGRLRAEPGPGAVEQRLGVVVRLGRRRRQRRRLVGGAVAVAFAVLVVALAGIGHHEGAYDLRLGGSTVDHHTDRSSTTTDDPPPTRLTSVPTIVDGGRNRTGPGPASGPGDGDGPTTLPGAGPAGPAGGGGGGPTTPSGASPGALAGAPTPLITTTTTLTMPPAPSSCTATGREMQMAVGVGSGPAGFCSTYAPASDVQYLNYSNEALEVRGHTIPASTLGQTSPSIDPPADWPRNIPLPMPTMGSYVTAHLGPAGDLVPQRNQWVPLEVRSVATGATIQTNWVYIPA